MVDITTNTRGKRIMKNATFARYDGLAVVIILNMGQSAQVRFCGPKGKQITRGEFLVDWTLLTEF